ncbi:unnamed protein product, partial [Prunus brigantina]
KSVNHGLHNLDVHDEGVIVQHIKPRSGSSSRSQLQDRLLLLGVFFKQRNHLYSASHGIP